MTSAELLRLLRIKNVPRKAFAYDLGISQSTVWRWINRGELIKRDSMAVRYWAEHGEQDALAAAQILQMWPGTQRELADAIGMTTYSVNRMICGRYPITMVTSMAIRQAVIDRNQSVSKAS